jgi:hypothetical protein
MPMSDKGQRVGPLRYLIVGGTDPEQVSWAVSELMNVGWELHGDLKLQPVADAAALTFSRLTYIQALKRTLEGEEGISG